MIWPVEVSTVTQEFAAYPNPDYQPDGHTGMDFGVNVGTPIRAAGAGTVLWADWAQGLGWPNPYYIAIDFDGPANGDQSAGIVVVIDHGPCATLYAHLDQTGLNPGDKVAEGEVIGQTGNTGRSSGPHLHFEVLPDGWDVHARWFGRVNPRNAIAPQGTTIKEDTLSAAEVKEIKDHINAVLIGGFTWKGKKHPGGLMVVEEEQRRAAADRANLPAAIAAAVWATVVKRTGGSVSALQELADVKSKLLGIEPVIAQIQDQTDPAALADLIPDALAQQVIDALAARLNGAK